MSLDLRLSGSDATYQPIVQVAPDLMSTGSTWQDTAIAMGGVWLTCGLSMLFQLIQAAFRHWAWDG